MLKIPVICTPGMYRKQSKPLPDFCSQVVLNNLGWEMTERLLSNSQVWICLTSFEKSQMKERKKDLVTEAQGWHS